MTEGGDGVAVSGGGRRVCSGRALFMWKVCVYGDLIFVYYEEEGDQLPALMSLHSCDTTPSSDHFERYVVPVPSQKPPIKYIIRQTPVSHKRPEGKEGEELSRQINLKLLYFMSLLQKAHTPGEEGQC